MKTEYQTIEIHPLAPEKPPLGAACNGCGVCCAAEPCPVSLVLFRPRNKPCVALEWDGNQKRYLCGMVMHPSYYLPWIPSRFDAIATRIFKRWIAADQHCDADVTFIHD